MLSEVLCHGRLQSLVDAVPDVALNERVIVIDMAVLLDGRLCPNALESISNNDLIMLTRHHRNGRDVSDLLLQAHLLDWV